MRAAAGCGPWLLQQPASSEASVVIELQRGARFAADGSLARRAVTAVDATIRILSS